MIVFVMGASCAGKSTYIKENYPDFYKNNVHLMMTVIDVSEMPYIAKEWHEDEDHNPRECLYGVTVF